MPMDEWRPTQHNTSFFETQRNIHREEIFSAMMIAWTAMNMHSNMILAYIELLCLIQLGQEECWLIFKLPVECSGGHGCRSTALSACQALRWERLRLTQMVVPPAHMVVDNLCITSQPWCCCLLVGIITWYLSSLWLNSFTQFHCNSLSSTMLAIFVDIYHHIKVPSEFNRKKHNVLCSLQLTNNLLS